MIIKNFLEHKPVSLLTLAYIVGLSLIAGMSIGAHLVVKRVIIEQEESARTINIAGRQRMLSQRTALFMTNTIINNNADAQNNLLESINLFEKSHHALTKGNTDIGLSGNLPEPLQKIYYREPYNLDQTVRQYIKDVRAILADINNGIRIDSQTYQRAKTLAEGKLLNDLDVAVIAYERNSDEKIKNLVTIQGISILAILGIILLEAIVIFRPLITRIKKYSERMETIASTDELTDVLNRRAVFEIIHRELQRAKRHDHDLALLICDIDHFKNVNDEYGHQTGDEALKHFSHIVETSIRAEDVLGRIGGEEFLILLPLTNKEKALLVAEKLRRNIEEYPLHIDHKGKKLSLPMTASFGVTTFDKFTDNHSNDLYNRADEALYAAKENGRNRVEAR